MLWLTFAACFSALLTLYGPVELTRYILTYQTSLEAKVLLTTTSLELATMWAAWIAAQLILFVGIRRLKE